MTPPADSGETRDGSLDSSGQKYHHGRTRVGHAASQGNEVVEAVGKRRTNKRKKLFGREKYFRFDRGFRGIGRIRLSSGAKTTVEFGRRNGILTKLYENGRLDVLRALKTGKITITQLVDLDRRDDLKGAFVDLNLSRPLWKLVDEYLPNLGKGSETRRRYATSWRKLQNSGILTDACLVRDLEFVEWKRLRTIWNGSPSDWNHLRRAVSAFLSAVLGNKHHPFRSKVVEEIPIEKERERVPDLTPELFMEVAGLTPDHARASYYVLAITGLRLGEYLALGKVDLMPATCQIRIGEGGEGVKGKTNASYAVIRVHPSLWHWVEAGVPSNLRTGWLRKYWYRACKARGVPQVHLHDLRHCTAQWLVNDGQDLASVKATMRHTTLAMTERYARRQDTGENATAMASILATSPRPG